jgi:manganese/iron transport system ATP-binding protein
MTMDLVRLCKAEIGYKRPLLPPIDLTVRAGERIAVLGPNGSGKSTLLRTVSGVLPVLAGEVSYPLGRRPTIGYVPQAQQLDPAFPLNTHEVVLMGRYRGLGVARRPRPADHEATSRLLEQVGLAGQEAQLFRQLSGGQRQRALLARALVGGPEILALDEPTSELDPGAEHGLLALVDKLASERKTCVLFATHQVNAAAALASEIVFVDQAASLVEVGAAATMLTCERLSQLYRLPIELVRADQCFLGRSPRAGGQS